MSTIDHVKAALGKTLNLEGRSKTFTEATPLFGGVPEFDSMSVLQVIVALEERFGITIEDDDIGAETFETVGSLVALVDRKLGLR